MQRKRAVFVAMTMVVVALLITDALHANPWNGKVVLQGFWWDCVNRRYQTDADGSGGWYPYLTKLAPRLRDMGFDGIWVPSPCKGASGRGMGYDLFDHYDLGQKFQKGTTATRFGDQDAFLKLIAVAHANGLEIYPDIVLNHMNGGEQDPAAWGNNKHKTFQYHAFSDPKKGRWLKSWLDFHPNPHHAASDDDWRKELFGPDICYRAPCCDHDCSNGGHYMQDQARQWFVWFRKQSDADGFRFDAVKHFPPEVVDDLLYHAMDSGRSDAEQRRYFAVGEFVVNDQEQHRIDDWASRTNNRCGTFDFALREALTKLVGAKGFYDLGSIPNFQQRNRFKTVPFVNNHDTWRGVHSDSSGNGQSDHSSDFKNRDELLITIDPDNSWAKVAYAIAFAIDGSPQVYYEDLFRNNDPATREKADPTAHPTRSYVENLVWCHQKLNFKDGAYKVRFQGSQDLLVIERAGKALIAVNDNGDQSQTAAVTTDFGAHAPLHDYSGSTSNDLTTDAQGAVTVTVPPKTYCVWGSPGIGSGFTGHVRRTTQEFQCDDDLGDSDPHSLGYGGKLLPQHYRTAGAIYVANGTTVRLWAYSDQTREIDLRVLRPDPDGRKSSGHGSHEGHGNATRDTPAYLTFTADREGFHQLTARLNHENDEAVRAYLKVEYEAPKSPQF